MTTKTRVSRHHFSVDSKLVVELTRQAYWMENREKWALDTLRCYQGISEQQIYDILTGVATLDNHPDGKRALFVATEDREYQEELRAHLAWQDSKCYVFAGRRVPRELVDFYVDNVVKRLRDAMRTPGAMMMLPATYLMDLERQREEQHRQIFLAAGFTDQEIARRTEPSTWSPEFAKFDDEFSAYLNRKTNWLQEDRDDE